MQNVMNPSNSFRSTNHSNFLRRRENFLRQTSSWLEVGLAFSSVWVVDHLFPSSRIWKISDFLSHSVSRLGLTLQCLWRWLEFVSFLLFMPILSEFESPAGTVKAENAVASTPDSLDPLKKRGKQNKRTVKSLFKTDGWFQTLSKTDTSLRRITDT